MGKLIMKEMQHHRHQQIPRMQVNCRHGKPKDTGKDKTFKSTTANDMQCTENEKRKRTIQKPCGDSFLT